MSGANFRTVAGLPDAARLLVRLDLNSPIENGLPRDNRRIARHAETVRELAAAGHRVVCLSHQGRPGRDDFTSLRGHAELLADHLDRPVEFVADVYGPDAVAAIRDPEPGGVLLLENVRMCEDELPEREPAVHADSEFVRTLAPEFDAYVNDAYSASHRSHASLVGFPPVLPAYAGSVLVEEYEATTAVVERKFSGPVTLVAGGTKATDVIDVLNALSDRVDRVLLGGIPGELFLRAEGHPVGTDVADTTLFGEQWAATRETIDALLEEWDGSIRLPVDLAYADADGERAEVAVDAIEAKTDPYRDVGSDTVAAYEPVIRDSAAVFVKGAVGAFEDERFADGTVGVLRAIAATDCFSVVGGGDTSRAIDMYGLDEADFTHVTIAGGAYLRTLTGEPLPAIELLRTDAAGGPARSEGGEGDGNREGNGNGAGTDGAAEPGPSED